MSRRSRLRDLLAASNVAGADVEREKIRAARDSANVATGVSALRDLVPGIANLYGDTVKRDDDKKEKLRLEGREDAANIAKLTREDSREAARVAREEAATKAKADAERAEREAKTKIDETKLIQSAVADDATTVDRQRDDARTAAKDEFDRDLRERELAAKGKKGAGAQKPPSAPKPPRPPPATVNNKLADFDSQIAMLEGLAARKEGVNLGPLDSRINSIAQKIGLDDEKTTKFKADTANTINAIISALSGANVPEGEFARLREGLPQPNDQDGAFMSKLQSKIEQLRAMRRFLEQRNAVVPPADVEDEDIAAFNAAFGGG